MTKDLLWRGMLVGILAAMLATLFARVVAEPQIDRAIGVEETHHVHDAMAMGSMPAHEEELVSRDTQKSAGLLTALVLYGAAVGGIFSLVFAYGYGRIALIGPRSFALLLAGLAFVLIVVVPNIKYPQTPPAVGKHETVGIRTAAYFAMIALSIGAAVIAGKFRTALTRSMRGFDASLLAVGAYVLLVMLGQFLLPTVDEVPSDFPATLLWNFRVASTGTQLILWATIGIAFGLAAERVLLRQRG
ncbi:MAG TPA: CbtA family protein [Sphingobium sp.]|uniref:CbtA family protein n=1 Tax=Sphingobium sp. TaxID=1912891 RepID=UPI002ED324BD